MDGPHALIVFLVVAGLNFFPWLVALLRSHNAKLAIFVTILLTDILSIAAFAGIGPFVFIPGSIVWFACFIWSLNGNTRRRDKRQADLIARAMASQVRVS
jgi:hypothetical protein